MHVHKQTQIQHLLCPMQIDPNFKRQSHLRILRLITLTMFAEHVNTLAAINHAPLLTTYVLQKCLNGFYSLNYQKLIGESIKQHWHKGATAVSHYNLYCTLDRGIRITSGSGAWTRNMYSKLYVNAADVQILQIGACQHESTTRHCLDFHTLLWPSKYGIKILQKMRKHYVSKYCRNKRKWSASAAMNANLPKRWNWTRKANTSHISYRPARYSWCRWNCRSHRRQKDQYFWNFLSQLDINHTDAAKTALHPNTRTVPSLSRRAPFDTAHLRARIVMRYPTRVPGAHEPTRDT